MSNMDEALSDLEVRIYEGEFRPGTTIQAIYEQYQGDDTDNWRITQFREDLKKKLDQLAIEVFKITKLNTKEGIHWQAWQLWDMCLEMVRNKKVITQEEVAIDTIALFRAFVPLLTTKVSNDWVIKKRTEAAMGLKEHLCGLTGYNPMLGDICPRCEQDEANRVKKAKEVKEAI